MLRDEPLQAGGEPVAGAARDDGGVGAGHLLDGEVAGRAGQRVGRQGAADLHVGAALAVEAGAEHRHDVLAAADAAGHRVAARDGLAEHREVGRHAEVACGAAHPDPEAGDDLVEDEQGAELVAQLAHPGVEVLGRRAGARLRAERLEHHGGRAAAHPVLDELAAQGAEVVREGLAGRARGAERDALGVHPVGAGHPQAVDQRVGPAVVRAADLDDDLVAGERPRGPDGGHDGLGARPERAVHLDVRHVAVDRLGELELVLVEEPGDRARTRAPPRRPAR